MVFQLRCSSNKIARNFTYLDLEMFFLPTLMSKASGNFSWENEKGQS